MTDSLNKSPQAPESLMHEWIIAGIVSASARFIPIPFVDDLVRDRCKRFVISRTLAKHDTDQSMKSLEPLYSGDGGCLTGCVGVVAKAPLKLLLFPIRKLVSIGTSVRGVPLEVMRMVLLGRTLDRCLRSGRFDKPGTSAADVRVAFEAAFAGMDLRVVRAAISDSLAGVKDWKASATASAKTAARPIVDTANDLDVPVELDKTASQVQEALSRPGVSNLFTEFDERFDRQFG